MRTAAHGPWPLRTRDQVMSAARRAVPTLPFAIVLLVILFAAILRLDGVTGRYGNVNQPAWVQALQEGSQTLVAILHPPVAGWEPEPTYPHREGPPTQYQSDPYTYLARAREMTSFYGAHYREPVFPFTVKLYLWVLSNQDVAVSFASSTFSLLCVLMTYFMGAMAFSRWVGCLAALGMAVERQVIFWGIAGWRDDAFAFAVVFCVCSMLTHLRKPSTGTAVALGLAAALACLTRIFSVSFLGPAFVYLLFQSAAPWRQRLRHMAIATATAAVLVAPYLVNCWRVYGDPLYTLNYQPLSYLAWEGAEPSAAPPGAVGYIGEKLLHTPFQTLDTAAQGMTVYPFLNKWDGFDPWLPGLGRWLAGAALAGLILFAGSTNGRLLLIVLLSAQVPFAFTWHLSSDWRYTYFTYSFFLVAAALLITNVVALVSLSRWRRLTLERPALRTIGGWAVFLGSIAAVAWTMARELPVLTFQEVLLRNQAGVIVAGPRDQAFFREGWSNWFQSGNVTERIAQGEHASVDIPLPRAADYDVRVRLNPFPRPVDGTGLPSVRILFNDVLLRTVALTWDPEKVGSYDLALTQEAVQPGRNRLTFINDDRAATSERAGATTPRRFTLWYVWVRLKAADQGASRPLSAE